MAATLMLREPHAPRPGASELRQTVLANLDHVEAYPTLSDTTVRVMEMINRNGASVAEVSAIVRRDGVLAVRVLRAANSCQFRGRNAVEDVQHAVLRMGLQECGKLLSTLGVKSVYGTCAPTVQKRCDAILRHSLFVARLASGICKDAGLGLPGLAFTAGLLHDIGRVVACAKCPEGSDVGSVVGAPEDEDTLRREREYLGIDHCAIGYRFAAANNLPEPVTRTILNHHRPAEETFHRELVALVAFAERLANHVQRTHNVAGYVLGQCPQFAVLAEGWTTAREAAFRTALPNWVVTAIRDTRAMLKSFE